MLKGRQPIHFFSILKLDSCQLNAKLGRSGKKKKSGNLVLLRKCGIKHVGQITGFADSLNYCLRRVGKIWLNTEKNL